MKIGRKYRAATIITGPSETDQSQAAETDVNVIVKRYAVTGTAIGNAADPIYGDFTQLPADLRGFIETAKGLNKHKSNLPPELQALTFEELATLDYATLAGKLQKPKPPADKPTEQPNPSQEPPK